MKQINFSTNGKKTQEKNKDYVYNQIINNLEEMKEMALYDHSSFNFKNNERLGKNFLSTNVLIGDIDNGDTENPDKWITKEQIFEQFKDYSFYLIPSRNHKTEKIKNGVVYPSRPKFHIYFPLSKTYENKEEVLNLYKNFLHNPKNYMFDQAVCDVARFIFSNESCSYKDECYSNEGVKTIDIDYSVDKEVRYSILDELFDDRQDVLNNMKEDVKSKKEESSKWKNPENYLNISSGNRQVTLLGYAGYLSKKINDFDIIENLVRTANDTYKPPLEEDGIVSVMNSIKNYHKEDVKKKQSNEECYRKEMLDRYSVFVSGGKVYAMENNNYRKLTPLPTFEKILSHKKIWSGEKKKDIPFYEKWIEDEETKRYKNIICENEDDTKIDNMGFGSYNLWRGFSTIPSNARNCEKYHDLIKRIICNNDEVEEEYILNWIAQMVQNPTNKSNFPTCLSLKGNKGVGKGVFAERICDLFNESNYLKTSVEDDIYGKFADVEGKVLIFGDEIGYAGSKRTDNRMKDLITSSSLRVERKYEQPKTTKNVSRIILSTNNDWSVPVTDKERRYVVLAVSPEEQQNTKYFSSIDREWKTGGKESFLYEMLNRDISNVDWSNIPKGEEYQHQKSLNYDIVQKYIEYSFDREEEVDFDDENLRSNGDILTPDEISFLKYKNRFENKNKETFVSFTTDELFSDFENFREKFGNQNDKNYPITKKLFLDKIIIYLLDGVKIRNQKRIQNNSKKYYNLDFKEIKENWIKQVKS